MLFQTLTDTKIQNWVKCFIYLFDNKVKTGGFSLSEAKIKELKSLYLEAKIKNTGKSRYELRVSDQGVIRRALETPSKLQGRPGLRLEFAYLFLAALEQTKNVKGQKVEYDEFYDFLKSGLPDQLFHILLNYDKLPSIFKEGQYKIDFYDPENEYRRELLFNEVYKMIPGGHMDRTKWRNSLRFSCLASISDYNSKEKPHKSNAELLKEELEWLKTVNFSKPSFVQSDIELLIMKRKGLISHPIVR